MRIDVPGVDGESFVEARERLLPLAADSQERTAAVGVRHRKRRVNGQRAFVATDHLRAPAAALLKLSRAVEVHPRLDGIDGETEWRRAGANDSVRGVTAVCGGRRFWCDRASSWDEPGFEAGEDL